MDTPKSTVLRSLTWAFLHTVVHALVWLGVTVVLVLLSGKLAMIYRDFDVELPASTQLFLSLAQTITRLWYVFIPVGVVLLAVDLGVLFLLDRLGASRVVGVLWSVLILAVAAVLLLAIFWALLVPLSNLISNLS